MVGLGRAEPNSFYPRFNLTLVPGASEHRELERKD